MDIDNLMAVTKIVPHLIPFIVKDYKEKIAGWLEGTEVGQDELAEIHSTLVNWHNKIGKQLKLLVRIRMLSFSIHEGVCQPA